MSSDALHRLMRNNRAMIRWMCRASISNSPPIEDLLEKLGIRDLADLIRERRLRWYGHVERSSSEINRVRTMPIPGKRGPGRPAMTWDECVNKDLTDYELTASDTQNRTQWRASERKVSARDSQLAPTSLCGSPSARMDSACRMGPRTRSSIKTKRDLID